MNLRILRCFTASTPPGDETQRFLKIHIVPTLATSIGEIIQALEDQQTDTTREKGYSPMGVSTLFGVMDAATHRKRVKSALENDGSKLVKLERRIFRLFGKFTVPKGWKVVQTMDATLDDNSDFDSMVYRFPRGDLLTLLERKSFHYDEFPVSPCPLWQSFNDRFYGDPRREKVLKFWDLLGSAAQMEYDRRQEADQCCVLVPRGHRYRPSDDYPS